MSPSLHKGVFRNRTCSRGCDSEPKRNPLIPNFCSRVSPFSACIRIRPGNLVNGRLCSLGSLVFHRRWQMRHQLVSAKQARRRRLIPNYFPVRKESVRSIASCPDPPASTVYSSSGSNSVTAVCFLKLSPI